MQFEWFKKKKMNNISIYLTIINCIFNNIKITDRNAKTLRFLNIAMHIFLIKPKKLII